MTAIVITLMTLAYGLAGLFCEEVEREMLVQRQQDRMGSRVTGEWVINDQEIKGLGQFLDRKVGKFLQVRFSQRTSTEGFISKNRWAVATIGR